MDRAGHHLQVQAWTPHHTGPTWLKDSGTEARGKDSHGSPPRNTFLSRGRSRKSSEGVKTLRITKRRCFRVHPHKNGPALQSHPTPPQPKIRGLERCPKPRQDGRSEGEKTPASSRQTDVLSSPPGHHSFLRGTSPAS